jgi:hypothetical protein
LIDVRAGSDQQLGSLRRLNVQERKVATHFASINPRPSREAPVWVRAYREQIRDRFKRVTLACKLQQQRPSTLRRLVWIDARGNRLPKSFDVVFICSREWVMHDRIFKTV